MKHKLYATDNKLQDTKHNIFSHRRNYIHFIYIFMRNHKRIYVKKYISSEP